MYGHVNHIIEGLQHVATKKTVIFVFSDTKQKLLDSHVYESAGVFWTKIKFNCLTYFIWLYFRNTCILLLIVNFLILLIWSCRC